jgi:hypothetical protein
MRQTHSRADESSGPQQDKKDREGAGKAKQHALTLAVPPIKKALGLAVLFKTAS